MIERSTAIAHSVAMDF